MKQQQRFNNVQTVSNFVDQDLAIKTERVNFAYPMSEIGVSDIVAVRDVSLQVQKGLHIAILGRNGSGKSTLAKLFNALELPDQGEVVVFGMNTLDDESVWSIRQACGMVFQNPDNQIVGTTVEEDVAFGPENLGIPSAEIRKRVDQALAIVGLSDYASKAPSQLSGGQKQKLAIAGILAMQPLCFILDESTSMLDPGAAGELMTLIKSLQQEQGMTIIEITHDIESAILADYIYIMQQGEIFFSGTPREVFTRPDKVLSAGLDLPQHLYINYLFNKRFKQAEIEKYQAESFEQIFTTEETVNAMFELSKIAKPEIITKTTSKKNEKDEVIISVQDLSFTYQKDTEFAVKAVQNVSFEVRKGEMIAVVGHSGSGKSTLISHLNGLIVPQQGVVKVVDLNTSYKKDIPKIRKQLGLLFQYPEHQLFESTVYDDIAFGPKQFGIKEPDLTKNIEQAVDIVGLPQDILQRSPFELSGGQQRRVAIAGVLATDCSIYVLDEPAAGLDPIGQQEIFGYIEHLRDLGKTIILVTHDMKLAAEMDRILVLSDGKLACFDTVEKVFSNSDLLKKSGLEVPAAYNFAKLLSEKFGEEISGFTADQVTSNLIRTLNRRESDNDA